MKFRMKINIENLILIISFFIGVMVYILFSNKIWLVGYAGSTMVMAPALLLCVGLIYKNVLYKGSDKLVQWELRDLICIALSSEGSKQIIIIFLALVSIIMMIFCIFALGFWSGFFATHIILGR